MFFKNLKIQDSITLYFYTFLVYKKLCMLQVWTKLTTCETHNVSYKLKQKSIMNYMIKHRRPYIIESYTFMSNL